MTVKEKRDIKRKLNVINHAKKIGSVKKACRYYGVSSANAGANGSSSNLGKSIQH